MSKPKTMKIDEVEYVRADSVCATPPGPRKVVVIDRGWVFAGDVREATGAMLTLDNAIQVRSWSGCGFEGMITNPSSSKVTLGKMTAPVQIPAAAVLFMVPVAADWGNGHVG